MSGGHAHSLYLPGETLVHRLRPQVKIAAVLLFVLVVVATPGEQRWAFAVYALLLAGVVALARIPPATVARRALIEVPFVLFAVLLPFLEGGPEVTVLGVGLSQSGLQSAFVILAKGTLGVVASITLAATTQIRDLLHGLERLRLPKSFVMIMGFMIRYLDVITGEAARMRVAREARGYDPRWIWQVKALASTAGTLFIRSYERGERVYLAMVSRGYEGSMPVLDAGAAAPRQWATGLVLPAAALVVALSAWAVQL